MTTKHTTRGTTDGPLKSLLMERFPDHKAPLAGLAVTELAADLGTSHETLYRALRANKLSQDIAEKIILFSRALHPEKPIREVEMLEFLFGPEWTFDDLTYVDPLAI